MALEIYYSWYSLIFGWNSVDIKPLLNLFFEGRSLSGGGELNPN
jgi:hypothetical protein